jgi:hypothetical protein
MKTEVIQAIVAGDASGNLSSQPIFAQFMLYASVQVVIAGGTSPTGALKVQFSNDPGGPQNTTQPPTHWSDVPSATVSATDNGVYAIPKFDVAYNWLKLVWTFTSGTGTLSANMKTTGA